MPYVLTTRPKPWRLNWDPFFHSSENSTCILNPTGEKLYSQHFYFLMLLKASWKLVIKHVNGQSNLKRYDVENKMVPLNHLCLEKSFVSNLLLFMEGNTDSRCSDKETVGSNNPSYAQENGKTINDNKEQLFTHNAIPELPGNVHLYPQSFPK